SMAKERNINSIATIMGLIRRLKVTQRAMERAMLGVSLRDQIRNEDP
ncbi:jg26455, partial [Pararge aegeria aegeria]